MSEDYAAQASEAQYREEDLDAALALLLSKLETDALWRMVRDLARARNKEAALSEMRRAYFSGGGVRTELGWLAYAKDHGIEILET